MRLKDPAILLTWPAPNYVDPVTRGPILYIINGFFFGLATIAVWTRIYTRAFVRKWVGLDDYLILFAWISGCGDMAVVFWGYDRFWWDRHFWDRRNEFLVPGAKATMAAKLFWTTTSTTIRLSVLVFYYRLLKHVEIPGRRYRLALHLTTAFVISIYICYLFTSVFACYPVAAYWQWPSLGHCLQEGDSMVALSSINTFSEALVASLPIPIIFQLQMDPRTRWSVVVLLCLGYFVAIVGSVRTVFLYILYNTNDLTWWSAPHWMCSEVEISVAIICASVPSLRPVIARLLLRHKRIVKKIKRRYHGDTRHTESTAVDDNLFSHATYWKNIDIEGISVDGLGYTVTITAGPNLEKRKPNRLRKTIFSDDFDVAEKQKLQDLSPEAPKLAFFRRLSRGARSSWGSWGMAPRTTVVTPKPPMEIATRQSLEVIEEIVLETGRPTSESSFYMEDASRSTSWYTPPNARNTQSFFIEGDMETEE